MKTLTDAYHRPQNCEELTTIKVNPEIWAKLTPETRSKDIRLQKTQARLNKAVMALSTVAETLLTEKGSGQPQRSQKKTGDMCQDRARCSSFNWCSYRSSASKDVTRSGLTSMLSTGSYVHHRYLSPHCCLATICPKR